MTGLIVIGLICSLLLAMTGSLSLPATGFLLVSGGAALFVMNLQVHQARHQLVFRSHELGASSALPVRHLGGLPFPIPTPANLFLTSDFVRIETEHDSWQIGRTQLHRLVIMSADQIHQLPDSEIIPALSGGTSRLLSLIREKIRRGDSSLKKSKLLFLTFQPLLESSESTTEAIDEIVIFSFTDLKAMKKLLQREDLAERVVDFQPETGLTHGI